MTKIDIFSGFLGAGKTTLIKKLITEAFAGQQVVLIENEFGEIGIDGGFLKESGIQINELNALYFSFLHIEKLQFWMPVKIKCWEVFFWQRCYTICFCRNFYFCCMNRHWNKMRFVRYCFSILIFFLCTHFHAPFFSIS